MIVSVSCDKPTFRPVKFLPGFNVVIADRTKESTRKGTRNGLGKTTLIEIIHFCLASRLPRDSVLRSPELADWTFRLELLIAGKTVKVSRNTAKPARVFIEGNTSSWPKQPERSDGCLFLREKEWSNLLGHLMFGLNAEAEERKYRPSFRSLISYFMRRGRDAFSSPFEHHRKQAEWDKQVNNAFLLGLSWQDASDWQILKDREKYLQTLKKAAQSGEVERYFGTIGELEAQKVRLEAGVRAQEDDLRRFRVHPQYSEIETGANQITAEIHRLNNENIAERRILDFYHSSLEQEDAPDPRAVANLYAEAQVELPGVVRRRLDEAQEFHRTVVENRRAFLHAEIQRIGTRESEIRRRSDERSELMRILETHGALEEYTKLQQLHLQAVERLKDVHASLSNLRKFEEGASSLRMERETLQQRARSDYDERRQHWQSAVTAFNSNSEALYDAPGSLVIDLTGSGFRFDVHIERSGSQGINNMKILCYDLMLAEVWSSRPRSPGFLVHDSTIFDGVDERQVALGLQRAAHQAEHRGFQYICALNSDEIPSRDLPEEFVLDQHVRLRLTDAEPGGSLLGVRF